MRARLRAARKVLAQRAGTGFVVYPTRRVLPSSGKRKTWLRELSGSRTAEAHLNTKVIVGIAAIPMMLDQATSVSGVAAERIYVDTGYRGHDYTGAGRR